MSSDANIETEVKDAAVKSGLPADYPGLEAAAKRCMVTVAKQGVAGYYAGAGVALFLAGPTAGASAVAAPGLAGLGMGIGAANAVVNSAGCADLREGFRKAISDWANDWNKSE